MSESGSVATVAPAALRFDEKGLITAVVQDATTAQVLMVAWMNAEALKRTDETGEAHFWSRSRQTLWHKGGHLRQRAARARNPRRLRRRHPAAAGRPRRSRLPYRRETCFYRALETT